MQCSRLRHNPNALYRKRSIGVAMIDAAEAEGKIRRGVTTLVEPTSGVHSPQHVTCVGFAQARTR